MIITFGGAGRGGLGGGSDKVGRRVLGYSHPSLEITFVCVDSFSDKSAKTGQLNVI